MQHAQLGILWESYSVQLPLLKQAQPEAGTHPALVPLKALIAHG